MFLDDIKNQVIGIDEVGRGAFSGPVVSCSILLSNKILNNKLVYEINDSKKLNEKKRIILADFIRKNSQYSIGISSSKEIDKINILQATILSMKRSYIKLNNTENMVKIDGSETFFLNDNTIFIKGGDQKSISIAAASIVAKTWRDKLMIRYSKIYPSYNWDKNKGYGTKNHIEAIKRDGITKIHRISFLKNLFRG